MKSHLNAIKLDEAKRLREAARQRRQADLQHAEHVSADAALENAAGRQNVWRADLFRVSRGELGVAAIRPTFAEDIVSNETKFST